MKNYRGLRKPIKTITIVLVILFSLFTIFNAFANPMFPSVKPSFSANNPFNNNWTHEGQIIHIPYTYKLRDSHTAIKNVLPVLKDDEHLIFKSNYSAIQVEINNQIIYQYNQKESFSASDFYYYIPLQKEHSQQEITIYFTASPYQNTLYLTGFYLNTPESFLMNEVSNNVSFLIFTAILIILGIILIGFYGWQRYRHSDVVYNYFLYLGSFVLLAAIWLFTDSEIPQVWLSNYEAIFIVSIYSFMLLPFPLLCLVDTITNYQHKTLNIIKGILLLNVIAQSVCKLMLSFDLMSMLPITHILYVVSLLTILGATIKLFKHKPLSFSDKCYIVSIFVLLGSSAISLVRFILFPYLSRRVFFEFGLFCFIIILLISILHKFLAIVDTHKKTSFYKIMAYTDLSTHTLNRSAFDEQMSRLTNDQDYIVLAMFDLNELKNINDTYGHIIGDKLLIAASECIRKTFEGVGETYRYGGDEFVTIIVNQAIDMTSLLNLLSDEIAEYNSLSMHKLSIAGGFAVHEVNTPLNARDLLREADQNMYESKHHYRANKETV